VSLVYDLKAKTATVDGSIFTGVEIVDVWKVGVASGVVDFKEKKATLTFTQPVEAKMCGTVTLCLSPAKPPPPPPPPEPRRRRRRRTAEVAEAWYPGAVVSATAERALSAVEPLAGPLLFRRRDYEFPRATFIDYDGAFHWIKVEYLEDSAEKVVEITRKLRRAVLSNLEAEGLYVTLKSAYYAAFIEVSHGDFRVHSTKKPFYVKIAGREATVGPSSY